MAMRGAAGATAAGLPIGERGDEQRVAQVEVRPRGRGSSGGGGGGGGRRLGCGHGGLDARRRRLRHSSGGRRPAQLTSRLAVPRNRSPRPCRIEGWADRIDRVARTARRQAVVGGGRRGSAEPRTAGAVGAASSDDFLPNPCTATSSRCPCGSRHAGAWALLRRLRGFLPPLQR